MSNTNSQKAAENAAQEEMQKKLAEAEAKVKAAEEAAAAAEAKVKMAEEAAAAAEQKTAEAEAKLKVMAEATPAEEKPDTVTIKIPLERNSSNEDVQVFINGRQYIIRRGTEVEVPRGVAEILANREKMLEVIDAFNKKNAQ